MTADCKGGRHAEGEGERGDCVCGRGSSGLYLAVWDECYCSAALSRVCV